MDTVHAAADLQRAFHEDRRLLGEVIASKCADAPTGRRNLEILVAATLEASLADQADGGHERHAAVMDSPSAHALEAYRSLVLLPGFIDSFRASTPLAKIAALNIGSRAGSASAARYRAGFE